MDRADLDFAMFVFELPTSARMKARQSRVAPLAVCRIWGLLLLWCLGGVARHKHRLVENPRARISGASTAPQPAAHARWTRSPRVAPRAWFVFSIKLWTSRIWTPAVSSCAHNLPPPLMNGCTK
jgi:hypothetical protein